MKKGMSFFILFLFSWSLQAQSGRYAGAKKILIGKTYTDSRNIQELKGWLYRGGDVLEMEAEMITVDIFQKGTGYVLLFSIKEDTASAEFSIADVIEIKNVTARQEIKTSVCCENGNPNVEIFAVVNAANKKNLKALKAWRFSRDKRRIQIIPVKDIACLNEGFGG
jgi:hypothetical protein